MTVKELEEEKRAEGGRAEAKPGVALTVFLSILFLIGLALLVGVIYYKAVYNVDLSALIYTMVSPLKGTDSGIITGALKVCLPPIILAFALYLTLFLISRRRSAKESDDEKGKKCSRRWRIVKLVCIILSIVMFVGSVVYAFFALNIIKFVKSKTQKTTIYEERYVTPDASMITADGKTKNLIYIYLESMETTYSSTDVGGRQDVNYMPGLTKLASKNLTFTDKKGGLLGGFHNPAGTVWTMGAILATTSGVPFAFPVERNSMSKRETFAPGLVNLGDILEGKGYTQEFLCGSDAEFGGRKNYFTQHGNYRIFDLFSAREKGYIPKDYKVWWGYEDEYLYEIAKDEITNLAKEGNPFNFTMLTVDTHHVDGYVCKLCTHQYDSTTANVVSCADRQVTEFVEWVKEQDFYKDTVVIITGDHPRMDTNLVADVDYYDRTVYNCILNTDAVPERGSEGRTYTPMDMFPTILEAMGFDVEGDRLGLGTSMFSDLPTIAEEMAEDVANEKKEEGEELTLEEARRLGYERLNDEVSKYSDYYVDTFSK